MDLVWVCKCCGKQFDTLPFAFALDVPDPWQMIPEPERSHRAALSTDACVIDGKVFCIRGRVEIPVVDSKGPFVWGLWASVSQAAFDRIGELWETSIRDQVPPLAAALCSDIPIYPATTGLNCSLHLKNHGRRPSIVLDP